MTPLHKAAKNGHIDIVTQLIEKGGHLDIEDAYVSYYST